LSLPPFSAYLASLEDQELTELALHEYKTATNMTEQFAALAAIAQNPGKIHDEVLADFYTKWRDDFLVNFLLGSLYCLKRISHVLLLPVSSKNERVQ
jgi:aminopeptidase N